jgi:hypothetical protein
MGGSIGLVATVNWGGALLDAFTTGFGDGTIPKYLIQVSYVWSAFMDEKAVATNCNMLSDLFVLRILD